MNRKGKGRAIAALLIVSTVLASQSMSLMAEEENKFEAIFQETDAAVSDVPEIEVPETEASETVVLETAESETGASEMAESEIATPEAAVQETAKSETDASDTAAPETTMPEADVPETTEPEMSVPDTSALEMAATERETQQGETAPKETLPDIDETSDELILGEETERNIGGEAFPEEQTGCVSGQEMTEAQNVNAGIEELQYEDGEVIIRAKISAEGRLPQDTRLMAEKLAQDSEEYQSAKELSRQETGASEQAEYSFYRVFFIADGQEIEPEDGTVSVQIEFKDQKADSSAKLQKVVHIEDQKEVKDVTAQTVDGNNMSSVDFAI